MTTRSEWISVEERLPEPLRNVLVYYGNLSRAHVYIARYVNHYHHRRGWSMQWIEGVDSIVTSDVTHWAILLEPPGGPRLPVEHELKIWPDYYEDIRSKDKTFEVRKNDRGYQVGDTLYLREWNPDTEEYTGNTLRCRVIYILHGSFGIQPDYCVMGLA